MALKKIQGDIVDGQITATESLDSLRAEILEGTIVILKDVFEPDDLRTLRQTVFNWGQETAPIDDPKQKEETTFHSVDVNPPGTHPKVYHSFNFILSDSSDGTEIDEAARPYFEKVRDFQNQIAETDGDFGDLSGLAMRPAIIHYPRGGGGFPLHTHPFLPQKIGSILSLSEYGEDYTHGGTRFAAPSGDVVDIEGHHDIGDIALFRIDLPHNVHQCDPDAALDFDDSAGRWSLILPYNRY